MDTIPIPAVLPPNHTSGPALAAMTWALCGVSSLLVGARLYSKIFRVKRFGLDDASILVAWICAILYAICIQVAVGYGFGRHYEYLSFAVTYSLLKRIYLAQLFLFVGPLSGRLSVALYLLAIIGKSKNALKVPLWMTIVLQAVANTALLITLYAVCGTDVKIIGNPETTCYRPSPTADLSFFAGSVNVATDAFLTLAPTILIWNVRTRLRTKYAAIALLSLSALPAGFCIWRTIEVKTLFTAGDWDFSSNALPYFAASSLETYFILICACVPTLGPLFKRKRRQGSTASSTAPRESGDSGELRYNLGRALGMNMPNLGTTTTITAGHPRSASQEEILPMGDMSIIKTSTSTTVQVHHVDERGEEVLALPSKPARGFVKFT